MRHTRPSQAGANGDGAAEMGYVLGFDEIDRTQVAVV